MANGQYLSAENFPEQVQDLVGFLDDSLPAAHPFRRVRAMPAVETTPQVWLLGSSDYSGLLAAQLGLRFAFAHFINAHGGRDGDPVPIAIAFSLRPRETAPVAAGVCIRHLREDHPLKPSA